MERSVESYGLDLHCTMILEEYRENLPMFEEMRQVLQDKLDAALTANHMPVMSVIARIKTEESLAGKLIRKGQKYKTLSDITDILGLRIVTFFSDDVDKISSLVGALFQIDWNNSIDKRKTHGVDHFGYMSLHYICTLPPSMYVSDRYPQINDIRFEIQMCSTLQHVWTILEHDTGYKSEVEIPFEQLRSMNRLAGVLELIDDEFCRLRSDMTEYRRSVETLVASGRFDDVELNGDTYDRYLNARPFDALNKRIAAVNRAEIQEVSLLPYLKVLKGLGCRTLGDVERFIHDNSEDAYQLAVAAIGQTDLDIIASSLALQDLVIVHLLKMGKGVAGLEKFFNAFFGENAHNHDRAVRLMEKASRLPFMQTVQN